RQPGQSWARPSAYRPSPARRKTQPAPPGLIRHPLPLIGLRPEQDGRDHGADYLRPSLGHQTVSTVALARQSGLPAPGLRPPDGPLHPSGPGIRAGNLTALANPVRAGLVGLIGPSELLTDGAANLPGTEGRVDDAAAGRTRRPGRLCYRGLAH